LLEDLYFYKILLQRYTLTNLMQTSLIRPDEDFQRNVEILVWRDIPTSIFASIYKNCSILHDLFY